MKKNKKVYTKIAGKIKKVDFQASQTPAMHLPDPTKPPADFHPGEDPIIQFKLGAERDEAIQKKKDMEIGAMIYVSWKNKLINRRHTIGQVLEALSELTSELDDKIQSEWKNYVINFLINPVIAHFHDMKIIKEYSQGVMVDCHKCQWGGIALFHKAMWEQVRCEMECPTCKTLLKQTADENTDMITEEEANKLNAKIRKGSK